jgi:4-methylaminobutanoate oxidase (formaldehyde-forming)
MKHPIPDRAQVVVIGGGVIGASTAYHLGKRGWTDVVVLEQNQLTSGTTWHAAGLVTQARGTDGTRQVVKRSLEIFKSLEAETGFSTGFVQTGTINLATSEDRVQELRRMASAMASSGVAAELIDNDRITELHPYLNADGLMGGLWFPHDGRGNATDTTISLIRGAQRLGVKLHEHTKVIETRAAHGRVTSVVTDRGEIEAEYVVNCAGMWGRQLAAQIGVHVPLQALAHYYVVTEEIKGLQKNLPTVKSGDDHAYLKDEVSALMVGFFEPGSYPWASRGIPDDVGPFIHLPEDWEHLGPFYEKMIERVPVLADAGIRLHFCGPESFTPDGMYHLGEAPNVRNYFIAAGFNSVGFLSGPGAGSVLADWIVDGRPSIDLPEADPGRVQHHEVNRRFLEQRAVEYLDESYEIHWPFQQKTSARGIRRSPLYRATSDAGAVFGELAGWERANWYAPAGVPREYQYSYGKQNWFEHSAAEHRAVRETAGLIDVSSFGKVLVQGRDAYRFLSRLSVNSVDVEPGRLVYTQWLNGGGGIESDVTVSRWSEDEWVVLSGPATMNRDLAWMRRNIGVDEFVTVADISESYAMVVLMGPNARDVLQPLTDCDVSNGAFPFGATREIDLGHGFVRANRMTYVGELGWELLIPTAIAEHVFEVVTEAGTAHGLRLAGYHAMNSLRMEKAYRSWGHDISALDTPLEAGLGFTVKWDKPEGFIGREALLRQRDHGVQRRLVQFLLSDPDATLVHDEPIFRDGELVGRVASTMYGHTLGASVALGWLTGPEPGIDRSWFTTGTFELEVACERIKAEASLRPLYDPKSERPKS